MGRYAGVFFVAAFVASAPAAADSWKLAWSDEFTSTEAYAHPDPSRWTYDVGGTGWGNHEAETYCAPGVESPPCEGNRPNAYLDGKGRLVVAARRNSAGRWTSARLTTRGLRGIHYGRVEAKMKLPVGAGLWPAFWMLGVDISSVGWPACGEIDILENVPARGDNPLGPGAVRATIHGPGYSGKNGIGRNYYFHGDARVDDGFHIYGVVWSQERVEFYVDDQAKPFFSVSPARLPKGAPWAFTGPFHLMLNLAVGGDWPGPPDQSTPNPALMLVDYVRVYEAVRR